MHSFSWPSSLIPEEPWSWPWPRLWVYALSLAFPILAAFFLFSHLRNSTIPGLFSIPNALPIVGHLYLLGDDHASICERLWRKYNKSVFQIRLGNTTAVVVNSFDDARRMLVSHQSALIDRPTLYTFHGVISSTQGFTIGSSPWDTSTRNRRQAAGKVLSRPAIRSYHDMFDLETYDLISDIYADGKGNKELDIRPYIQRLALNTTLTLCYGIRMRGVYDDLLREILEVGSAISLLRSASENYQDYIPILRYLPGNKKTERAKALRGRRDKYLSFLLDTVRERIKNGTDKPCVSAAILKGEETRLTDVEVSSICLSLVSGGFETIPATLTSCIGSLATEAGQVFQERAYEDIQRHYYSKSLDDIFLASFTEEKVPYVNALVKEAERYYTASAMNLPRKTTTDVAWDDGVVIPAKTMVLVNLQAANHDVDHFGNDADTFNPERWLEYPENNNIPVERRDIQGLPHMSFGAGARACSGQLVANRIIYTALMRLLSSYRIVASEEFPPNTHYADYNAIKSALVAIPRHFKVKLIPRDESELLDCLERGAQRTEKHYVV